MIAFGVKRTGYGIHHRGPFLTQLSALKKSKLKTFLCADKWAVRMRELKSVYSSAKTGTRQIKASCCPAGFPLCPVQFERKWPLSPRSGSLQTRVTIKNQQQRVDERKFAYHSPKHIRRDKQALRTLSRKTALKCSTYSFFLSNLFPFLPLSSSSVALFPTGTPFPRAARMNSIPLFRHTAQLLKQTVPIGWA